MTDRNSLFLLLLLGLSLACSLTTPAAEGGQAGALQAERTPENDNPDGTVQAALGQTAVPSLYPENCTVTASVLHLRECAGTQCRVLDWLEYGESLTILAASGDWLQVQTPTGETGWVKANYCGEEP